MPRIMGQKEYLCRDINGGVHIVGKTELIQRISVYAVLCDAQGVLLVRDRTRTDRMWDLPGGGVELGENLERALRREIYEEVNVRLDGELEKICEFTEYFYDVDSNRGWESTRHFYKTSFSGTPNLGGNNDDIVEARYFELPLSQEEVAPVAREIISLANSDLGG